MWLVVLVALFLLGLAALVGGSLLRPEPPAFAPSPLVPPGARGPAADTVTLDGRDPAGWAFFSFERGGPVADPEPTGWDVAVRRFHIAVNGGADFPGAGGARELGTVPLEEVDSLPADGYRGTEGSLATAARHAVLDAWYRYGFFTHLLSPRPVTYAVRTADGRYAALRILGYYCPGVSPGCLTFAYRWAGDGGRTLPP